MDPSKFKVTILASEWESNKGELSTINRELAIQLAKFPEVEITFFLPKCSDKDKKEALNHNVKIVEATRRPGYKELEWLSFPPEHLQIDIIFGHGVKLGRQVQVIRELKKCLWVHVVHRDPEELGMFKSYSSAISKGEEKHKTEVELCEMADLVIGVGPKLIEAFRLYLRGCQKDQNVIGFTPGVFEEFVSVEHLPQERKPFCILVCGRGDEDFFLKGFDIAGEAVAKLPDTRLVFVGAPDGKHEEIAKQLIKRGVPASRLRVRGFIQSRENLERLFKEMDLLLMPSRTEGFGLIGLEALSAGLPVLVSQNSGFGEALSNVPFGSSFVVNSEDPMNWVAAINKIRGQEGHRKRRLEEAKAVRISYAKKYNWATQIKDVLDRMTKMVLDAPSDCQSPSQTKSGRLLSAPQFSHCTEDNTEDHADCQSSSQTKGGKLLSAREFSHCVQGNTEDHADASSDCQSPSQTNDRKLLSARQFSHCTEDHEDHAELNCNMNPTFERFLGEIRQFLTEVRAGILSKEDEEYLKILADIDKNLENLQETEECDQTATLKNLGRVVLYRDYICLKNNTAVFSQKFEEVKNAESHGMPKILQRKITDIEGHFARLCELIKEMDGMVKEISKKINDVCERELTPYEKIQVKSLKSDFETVAIKTAVYYDRVERAMIMFESAVVSYKKDTMEARKRDAIYGGFAVLAAALTGGVAGVAVSSALLAAGCGSVTYLVADIINSKQCKKLETKCRDLNSKLRILDMEREKKNSDREGEVKKANQLKVNV